MGCKWQVNLPQCQFVNYNDCITWTVRISNLVFCYENLVLIPKRRQVKFVYVCLHFTSSVRGTDYSGRYPETYFKEYFLCCDQLIAWSPFGVKHAGDAFCVRISYVLKPLNREWEFSDVAPCFFTTNITGLYGCNESAWFVVYLLSVRKCLVYTPP
jgi:hypothetical protein